MKINLKNELKVTETLDSVQKRCSARLASTHTIKANLTGIERRLNLMLGGKKNWVGVRVTIAENFGTKPGAYKGIPESTCAVIEYFPSGWFLTSAERTYSSTNQKGDWEILLTDELKKMASEYMLSTLIHENT